MSGKIVFLGTLVIAAFMFWTAANTVRFGVDALVHHQQRISAIDASPTSLR